MYRVSRRLSVPVFVLAVLVAAATAHAHHSFIGKYDGKRLVSVSGTITSLSYGNPHVFFNVRAAGKGTWRIETESISRSKSKGLRKQDLAPGTKVTVRGWPAKNGAARMGLQSITLPGGRTVFVRSSAR